MGEMKLICSIFEINAKPLSAHTNIFFLFDSNLHENNFASKI